ncbi:glycosyltransferase family 2 protein [Leuconostoc suionicum]|uniref:glycosyltransferase family 2 protein n=1 Tax=Leuconostoc suionicum TaxID=1511761 RepID=UPI003D29C771
MSTLILSIEGTLLLLTIVCFGLGRKYHFLKQVLIIIYIITMMIYLGWRIGWTIPTNSIFSIILGVILILAEVGGFCLSLVFYRIFYKKFHRPIQKLDVYKDGHYPSVDVLIATYNEEVTILKRSIVAALSMKYPSQELVNIYVCDDGSRGEVNQLCQELGVHHVVRATHEHAKAGNLNHALTVSQGELVVTMDADMVPRTDFLEMTIGYFHNPKMGFIQTPQTFFNDDPYQFNLFATNTIGNDQDFFMRGIEQQKDAFNATMYVGSNAIFRRVALDSIGGFATGVITEDMATGMLLQAKKWETGFVNENLASGLAPETFGDLIKQRDRWARGNIQVAKKWHPWRVKGLNLMQRVIYTDGIHYWFSGIYKLVFLMAPIFFLVFGQYSLQTSFSQILVFWLPSFVASQLTFNLVSEKRQTVMLSNIYETATAPFMAYGVFNELFFKSKQKFAVTRKGVNSEDSFYNWRTAWPIIVLLVLSLLGLVRGILFIFGVWDSPFPKEGIYINIFWLFYNSFSLILASYLSNERPRLRKSERFIANQTVLINFNEQKNIRGEILDWNEDGARIALMTENVSKYTHGIFEINGIQFNFKCVWQHQNKDSPIIGITFENLDILAYEYIIQNTYAQASTKYEDPQYSNRLWHIVVKWWIDTLRRRKAH